MKSIGLLFFAALTFLIISCQPTKIVADTSCTGYKSVDFERNYISSKGIGIMPVLGGTEKEEYSRTMGDEITKHMRNEFGSSAVKSPQQVISSLNDAGIASDYANAISLYNTSSIIPKEMLSEIGEVLGVEYLLYVKLLADSEVDYVNRGMYDTSKNEVYELYLQTQVWSTTLGNVVWEGKGGYATHVTESVDLVQKSAEGISKIIGNEKDNGPYESPNNVIESVFSLAVKTYLAVIFGTAGVLLLVGIIVLAAI